MGPNWEWPEAKELLSEPSGFDPPSLFAKALAEAIPIEPHTTRLLDIGCGRGIIGLYCLAKRNAGQVTFNDIQSDAIAESRLNATRLIDQGTIRAVQVDFLDPCGLSEIGTNVIAAHDIMTFNPPQLPTSYVDKQKLAEITADPHNEIFRIAGDDGLKLAREYFRWYAAGANRTTKAAIVLSSFLGWSRITAAIHAFGLTERVIAETRIPLRTMLAAAADSFVGNDAELNDRSLTKFDGKWTKKLLVILVS
jgi:methylase of polypeptide subunit release factors